VTSADCANCHEKSTHGTVFREDVDHSTHRGSRVSIATRTGRPSRNEGDTGFAVGFEGCRTCHADAAETYQAHGRAVTGPGKDTLSARTATGTTTSFPPRSRHRRLIRPTCRKPVEPATRTSI